MSAAAQPRAPASGAADVVPSRTLAGIGLAVLGLLFFAANNTAMKWLVARYPSSEALFVRSLVSLAYLAPFMRVGDIARVWRGGQRRLHLVRVACSATEMMCFFAALSALPLAVASTFYLATPVYVTALSPLLLGEKVGWRRWCAVLVGFCGVLVALHPSPATISPAALTALAGGMLYSIVVILTRRLRGTPNHMLVALQLGAVFLVASAMANRDWLVPRWQDLGLMSVVGTLSVLGYVCFNQALRIAPASVVSPFQYSNIILAALAGYFVFGEVPGMATVAGAAIIIGAGAFIMLRQRVKQR